jgi:hypothetical protein
LWEWDISFTYVDGVEPLLNCRSLKKLNISGTHIDDVTALKNLRQLDSVSMWNLWLDREQIDELKENLPNLDIPDYQWDLYEKDPIGRVLPRLRHSNKTLLASAGCNVHLLCWPPSTMLTSPASAALQLDASLSLGPTRRFC